MLALGCSNFFGSFFKIHVICCALSVTLAVDGAGGKSQVIFGLIFLLTTGHFFIGEYLGYSRWPDNPEYLFTEIMATYPHRGIHQCVS